MYHLLIALVTLNVLLTVRSDKLAGGQIDFSKAVFDTATGMKCVTEESTVSTIEREKQLECVHKNVNTCHYGYVTKFKNHRVEECHDNYEKKCSISYKQVRDFFLKKWAIAGLFWFIFGLFQANNPIFTTNECVKMSVHYWDWNPRTSVASLIP